MTTPKTLSSFLVPEFEESETMNSKSKEIHNDLEEFLEDVTATKNLQQGLIEWGSGQFDKRRIIRSDYEEFIAMCNSLAVLVSKIETRYKTNIKCAEKYDKIEGKLVEFEGNISQLTREVREGTTKRISYAECIKLPGSKDNKSESKSKVPIKKTLLNERVVIIKPKEVTSSERETSEQLRKTIKNKLSKEQILKIKNAKNIRGGGVLLVLDSTEEVSKILGDKIAKDSKFKVSEPQKHKPKIVIYDVPEDIDDKALIYEVHSRNYNDLPLTDFETGFKPVFRFGSRDKKTSNWVVECSGQVRRSLIFKERVYIEWRSCKLEDYLSVPRCFKCQGLGHVSKYCKRENITCGHCSELGHDIKVCPNKVATPVCCNCKNQKKDANHKVSDKKCPSYVRAIKNLIDRTDYGN